MRSLLPTNRRRPIATYLGSSPSIRSRGRAFPARLGAFVLALAAIGSGWAGAAPPPIEIQNVRVGVGSGNSYKVGCWMPVRVQLKAGPARFSGFLELLVPDDDGVPTSYRQPVDVAPGETAWITAYGRPGGRETDLTLRILDADGRRILDAPQERLLPTPPRAILPSEMLIITLGQPMGVDQVPQLPAFAGVTGGGTPATPEVVVDRIDPSANPLPGRWYGFDAVRAVVIDTDDPEAMRSLDGLRGESLVDWVRHGGHLVVSVGRNWQAVRDSVLGPILPAVPNGEERVPSLEAIDTFAASTKPLTPVGTPPVMVARLERVDERGGKILSIVGNLPLVVRGAHGFGRVTVIGLAVDQRLLADWPDRGLFWARAIDLRHERETTANGAGMMGSSRFTQSGVSDLSSQLRIGLEQFPGVKLIPFGWVAFFIFLYILLIGPGDYLFLKKVLGRMELTWITFPLIVLTVSLLSYFAAYRLKGNDLLVNKVDVIDVDQPGGLVRGRTITTLFSPQNRDYGVGFLPVSPDLGQDVPLAAEANATGEPPRPAAGTELVTTWFSVPEAQFGAMGGSNRRFNFAGSGYAYQPTSAVERLENVRVPIWSTRSITGRWFGKGAPLVDADLRPVGTDRLSGTITNRRSFPLEDAILVFGKQVYLLGDIPAGAAVKVELSGDRALSGLLRDRASTYLSDQPWNRNAAVNRGNVMLAAMFHESEGSRGAGQAMGNAPLHDLDLTGQLALDRPMLVARIKRPGCQLSLVNAPSPPRIDQTTLLRIILPLNRTSPTARSANL